MSSYRKLATQAQLRVENLSLDLENINKRVNTKVKRLRKRVSYLTVVPTLAVPFFIGYKLFSSSKKKFIAEQIKQSPPKTTPELGTPQPSLNYFNVLLSSLGLDTSSILVGKLLANIFKI